MRRVTADSNVLVSALVFGGKPLTILEMAQAGEIELAISEPIINETLRIIRDKFYRSREQVTEMDGHLRAISHVVTPVERIDAVPDDEDDNKILECAIAAGSDVIVSGDAHLLRSTPSGTSRFGGRRISSRHSKLARARIHPSRRRMEFPFAIVQPYLTKGAPSYKLILATWPTKEELARVKEFAQVGSSEMKPCLTILATYPSDESVMVDLMSEMSEKYKAERVMSKGAICY